MVFNKTKQNKTESHPAFCFFKFNVLLLFVYYVENLVHELILKALSNIFTELTICHQAVICQVLRNIYLAIACDIFTFSKTSNWLRYKIG